MILRALGAGLLEASLPPMCAACDDAGREPFCRICAEALLPGGPVDVPGAVAAHARWLYGGPAAEAIQALKYGGQWSLGRPLGAAMAEALPSLPPVDVVVPVPVGRDRLVDRGFNQARELARGIPRPVRARALVRRAGPSQVGLDRAARLANLERAICAGPEPVKGARVLLVDDVITTGATAEAAIRALLGAGAAHVVVLAATHAELEGGFDAPSGALGT